MVAIDGVELKHSLSHVFVAQDIKWLSLISYNIRPRNSALCPQQHFEMMHKFQDKIPNSGIDTLTLIILFKHEYNAFIKINLKIILCISLFDSSLCYHQI